MRGTRLRRGRWIQAIITVFFLAGWIAASPADASTCDPWVARMVSIEGGVERRRGDEGWRPAAPGETFCFGDRIRVGKNGRAAIVLQNHTFVRLDAHTTLELSRKEESLWVDLLNGFAHFFSRTPRELNVSTPFVNASVEGTEFLVEAGPTEASVTVLEGKVSASNARGKVPLTSGQSAVAGGADPPLFRAVARPHDAVRWAFYYPPVLQFATADFEGHPPESWQTVLARSIGFYRQGNLTEAFETLENVDGTVPDSRFLTYRASLRLSVGRAGEALADIEQALVLNPGDGAAYALKAVIALVQNDRESAREAARRAVEAAPGSPGPHLALSLVRQADFQLEKARESVQRAVEAAPDRPLGWARLAEIHLMFGEVREALEAAEKSVMIDSGIAHTQTVLGYAHLSRIDLKAAEEAFQKAIALDQGAPLPRLGLGLLKIRKGSLEEGRREIEAAVILDPGNALIRSYLGKAYYEEKRDARAAEQYEMAMALDERDPTPYLYSAVLHQTKNRPVEALREVQKSIELNDSRAVYRSRLLLDEDLAVRGAGLGRIYQDLGFQQRALVEGSRSVTLAPEDHSGHRLLADAYAALPQQQQMARASEVLQSQLYQRFNIAPVRPQLAEANLAILEGTGASEISYNEFNPLFARNRVTAQLNGFVGNHHTRGDDLVLSGIRGPLSFSVGQFHYQSEGFRENNDLTHDIYNLFVQAAVTPQLNLQAELRRRETEQGDLALNFDPGDFSLGHRREIRQDSARLGGRYSMSADSDLIVSLIRYDREGDDRQVFRTVTAQDRLDAEGYQAEAQLLVRNPRFNFTAGVGQYRVDNRLQTRVDELDLGTIDIEQKAETVYIYYRLFFPGAVVWTLGGSYQTFEENGIAPGSRLDLEGFNPKLGLQWDVTDHLHFRAAYMVTIKQGLVIEQTIEPTQVAGFNQFFDDFNGTRGWRRGIGLDLEMTKNLLGGVEGTWHDLEIPLFGAPIQFLDRREAHYRAYLSWMFRESWAAGAAYWFDRFRNEAVGPEKLDTVRLPISVRYFSASGGIVMGEAVYLRQEVSSGGPAAAERDRSLLMNMMVGFRLPKRIGLITFEVKNLFDRNFRYQDTNFLRAEPVYPEFIPDRTVLARATIQF